MELSLKRLVTLFSYVIVVGSLYEFSAIHAQRTFLDKFINEYRAFRGGLFKFIGRSDTDAAYSWSLKRQVMFSEIRLIGMCS